MRFQLLAFAAAASLAGSAGAAITYDASVTNAVIFGDGNANGGFTVDTQGNLELGLRAKVRYDVIDDMPKNVFNSNGDGTYTHAAGSPASNPTRARWNFEWSVNTDVSGTGGQKISSEGLSYTLGMDFDPGAGTSFTTINLLGMPFDHSFGNNTTAMGAGQEAPPGNFAQFGVLAFTNNLMQNSWNLDFFDNSMMFFPGTFEPSADGVYSFYLQATDRTGALVARTDITVIVGAANVVPEPGSLALAGLGLLGAAAARRRRR